jgi:hypothetical protein
LRSSVRCPSACSGWMRIAGVCARLVCDAFIGTELVSSALDGTPEERAAGAALMEKLIDDAPRLEAQRPFRSTGFEEVGGHRMPRSILSPGLLLVLLSGLERLSPDPACHSALLQGAHGAGIEVFLAAPSQFPLENAIHLWGQTLRSW